jgi:hypothetical protein
MEGNEERGGKLIERRSASEVIQTVAMSATAAAVWKDEIKSGVSAAKDKLTGKSSGVVLPNDPKND